MSLKLHPFLLGDVSILVTRTGITASTKEFLVMAHDIFIEDGYVSARGLDIQMTKSLTAWWPDKGMDLPDAFSRHTTAHAIAEPDQVNPVNALIAIMLAVSLLRQEATSGWTALGTTIWNTETETDVNDTEPGADD